MGSENPAPRIADRGTAETFLRGLVATMRELETLLARESAGVRVGRLQEALSENERKSALSAAYLQGLEAVKANAVALKRFAPEGVEVLKDVQRAFAASVETNQKVLATARTVSEGLVRTLAEEIGRARTPTTYGMPSTPPSPYGRGAARGAPLVLSRKL